MIHYIILLIIMGLIWIVVTNWFRDRIKKPWLYVSFPVFIYSLPIILISTRNPNYWYYILFLLIIYSYLAMRVVKGLNTRDVFIIPLLVIALLIVVVINQVLVK